MAESQQTFSDPTSVPSAQIFRPEQFARPEKTEAEETEFGGGGGGGGKEQMEKRIEALEAANLDTRDRLARIETRLDHVATKADLHEAIGAQTWKIISWMTAIGIALIGATMGIVKLTH